MTSNPIPTLCRPRQQRVLWKSDRIRESARPALAQDARFSDGHIPETNRGGIGRSELPPIWAVGDCSESAVVRPTLWFVLIRRSPKARARRGVRLHRNVDLAAAQSDSEVAIPAISCRSIARASGTAKPCPPFWRSAGGKSVVGVASNAARRSFSAADPGRRNSKRDLHPSCNHIGKITYLRHPPGGVYNEAMRLISRRLAVTALLFISISCLTSSLDMADESGEILNSISIQLSSRQFPGLPKEDIFGQWKLDNERIILGIYPVQ
jgi:hypothetical protein